MAPSNSNDSHLASSDNVNTHRRLYGLLCSLAGSICTHLDEEIFDNELMSRVSKNVSGRHRHRQNLVSNLNISEAAENTLFHSLHR